MPITTVMFDTSADTGEKLDPAVRAEIDELAPSTIDDGDIKEPMLDDEVVSTRTIQDAAVTGAKIATGTIVSGNFEAGAVDTAALDDGAVTAVKTGTGVVTAYDHSGTAIVSKEVYLTAAQYALIGSPDANTTYYCVG
jgi:hypothetical protein